MPTSGRPARADRAATLRSRAAARRTRLRRRRLGLLGTLSVIVLAVVIANRTGAGIPSDKSASERAKGVHPLNASYFASGACMVMPPTKGNRHTTVFLDAGHGGIDPGGTGTTESGTAIYESELNLPVELDTAALLRAKGFTVVVSRTANTTVLRLKPDDETGGVLTLLGSHEDTAARDVCANDAHASLLVGIYMDSGSQDNAGSLTAYDLARPFAADNVRFAQLLQSDVLAAMNAKGWQIPNDGAVPDGGLGSSPIPDDPDSSLAQKAAAYDHLLELGPGEAGYFNTPSKMPGALIEPLYLSDPFEGSIADSTVGQTTIAEGIAKAVRAYFAPQKPGAATSATSAPPTTAPATTTAGA